jgi:hypothetical protein
MGVVIANNIPEAKRKNEFLFLKEDCSRAGIAFD